MGAIFLCGARLKKRASELSRVADCVRVGGVIKRVVALMSELSSVAHAKISVKKQTMRFFLAFFLKK